MSELLAERARPDADDDTFGVPSVASSVASRLAHGSARVAAVVIGATVVALAVAVTLWTKLGPGPLDVLISAVRTRTGLPLGLTIWLVVGAIIGLAWVLGARPGPATLIGPLVIGPVTQVGVTLLNGAEPPDSMTLRVAIHGLAVVAIGIGAGLTIVSGLGAGSGELLTIAAADRAGRRRHHVRLAFESTWLVVGVLLGGPIGIGTVVVALMIGPAVEFGFGAMTRVASARDWVRG